MSLKTSFKKKLYKFRYLEQTFLEYEELDRKGRDEFMSDLRKVHAKLNVYDEILDSQYAHTNQSSHKGNAENTKSTKSGDNIEQVKTAEKKLHDNEIKKAYRKIAKKLHPDKLAKNLTEEEKKESIKKFEKITEDYNDGNYTSLLVALDELNISVDKYDQSWLEIIDEKTSELTQKIASLKKSIYIVYASATEAEKNKILRDFMKERGWTSNLSAVKKSRKSNNHL